MSNRQHYVPQFVIERFGHQGSGDIHVFDKQTGKSFTTGASRIAAEWDFYNFEFKGFPLSLEQSLSELESDAAACIEKILQRGRLAVDEPEVITERSTLIRFLSIQLVRTRGAFLRANQLSENLREIFRNSGASKVDFELPPEIGSSENAKKVFFAQQICNASKDIGPSLLKKDWLLMATPSEAPFLIGDHPVVLDNLEGGKIGLNATGAVVYFPLSPQFGLGLHCESVTQQLQEGHRRFAALPDEVFRTYPEMYAGLKMVLHTIDCLSKGEPLALEPENVENFNSIQILEAERFIFSCDGNFDLVEDMIRENPRVKGGQRYAVG